MWWWLLVQLKSKWRMWRSVIYLCGDDLKALHADLVSALRDVQSAQGRATTSWAAIPALPARHERVNLIFKVDPRRLFANKDSSLEDWFRQVAETVERLAAAAPPSEPVGRRKSNGYHHGVGSHGAPLNVLLSTLELQPRLIR